MRFPLQISIAAAFTLLIVLLGATLIGFSYTKNKEVALLAAEDAFARIARETQNNIQGMYRPAEALVDLTIRLPAAEADNYSKHVELVQFFAKALRDFPTIASLFVGYDNGDFFRLRALRNDNELRKTLKASTEAAYAVDSIVEEGNKRIRTLYFYDSKLNIINTRQDPAIDYDPRTRIWYQKAIKTDQQVGSGLYVFHLPRVLGATLARRTPNGKAVVGADITMRELSRSIKALHITPSSQILIFNSEGNIAIHSSEQFKNDAAIDTKGNIQLPDMNRLDDPLLAELFARFSQGNRDGQLRISVANRTWRGSISRLPMRSGRDVFLTVLVPEDELLKDVRALRNQSLLISVVVLCIAVLLGWLFARRIAEPLGKLATAALQIRQLKLETPIDVRSHISEVDDLAKTMTVMKSAVQDFVEVSKALSAEPDFYRLLERLLEQARNACHADGGGIALLSDDGKHMQFTVISNPAMQLHLGGTSGNDIPMEPIPLYQDDVESNRLSLVQAVAAENKMMQVDDVATDTRFDFVFLNQRYARNDYRCRSVIALPLCNRKNEIIGVLELVNAHDDGQTVTAFRPELVSYVEALSSQAAITLDNRRLLKAQKDLLDAFIQLIAGAIDAKSPYTSGHCQRVPELARMLAEAAHDSTNLPFDDFHLNDEEWYELHIASWLHDCGKVTTPEYVVDKATKLEGLYNRIHEVRMRFEVLWRDYQIEQYQALARKEIDASTLEQRLDEKLHELRDDYAFIAECNVGGEFMSDDRIEKLESLAKHSWQRYFDDRIGLSQEESVRKSRTPAPMLPVMEQLLADKTEHQVERDSQRHPFGENHYGFDMDVPKYAYHYGELYNLSIQRGTLNDEERFKINEHITQTIMLLDKLPFPRELRRVPRWAGSHHEKLDGTGYPRRLKSEDLSIPERIMAIADIFEALTAADRPYKKAKTLSESLRIMSFMSKDKHICPQLFKLFLTSRIYRVYADQFLLPEQIDEVDINQFLNQ